MPCWHLDIVLSALEMQIDCWGVGKAVILGHNL